MNLSLKKPFRACLILLLPIITLSVHALDPPEEVNYTEIDSIKLKMRLFYPGDLDPGRQYPAILFFFGGGWNGGSMDQFLPHAAYFASRGMVGIVADYRVHSRHGTTPFDAVQDARSAIRFLRQNAARFCIDPSRIVASGGSAGGHLAAAAGNLPDPGEDGEAPPVSPRPDALVLFNPVFDNGPGGYGYERIGERYPEISPLHNIRPGAPPTIVFLGTEDRLIPVKTAKEYRSRMEAAGSTCELHLYEGQKHGFFNFRNTLYFNKTVLEADRFLRELGYLDKPSGASDGQPSDILLQLVTASEKGRVLQQAEQYRGEPPLPVTAWSCERSAGTLNDFYSEGDYWWPDPENPEGPYIRRDGMSNPDNFSEHRHAMIRMSRIVGACASAYLVTGDDRYVEQAMEHLRVWFITPQTRMNPHMLYAQAIQGRFTGRGIGIIDGIHLVEVALAIRGMESSPAIRGEELYALKRWFGQFLEWITTHEYGRSEMVHPNNHGTCWALQASAYALLTQDHALLGSCFERFADTLLPAQMAPDGSFPLELGRTKPYGYSIFNLDAFSSLAQLLSLAGYDPWSHRTGDGKSLGLGMEFLYPYIENKEDWPYPEDVAYFDEYPVRQAFLLFGALACRQPGYLRTWLTLESDPQHPEVVRNTIVRYPLLWLGLEAPVEQPVLHNPVIPGTER